MMPYVCGGCMKRPTEIQLDGRGFCMKCADEYRDENGACKVCERTLTEHKHLCVINWRTSILKHSVEYSAHPGPEPEAPRGQLKLW